MLVSTMSEACLPALFGPAGAAGPCHISRLRTNLAAGQHDSRHPEFCQRSQPPPCAALPEDRQQAARVGLRA